MKRFKTKKKKKLTRKHDYFNYLKPFMWTFFSESNLEQSSI